MKTKQEPETRQEARLKLTGAQRAALMEAANNKGVFFETGTVRTTLQYLGLIETVPRETKAAIDEDVEKAWHSLGIAVRRMDAAKADEATRVIREAKYRRDKTKWVLTAAAQEYLLHGRVTLTVGPRQEVRRG